MAPPEIADDASWILHVSGATPELGWIVGIGEAPSNAFGGTRWPPVKSLWLTPETRQVQQ